MLFYCYTLTEIALSALGEFGQKYQLAGNVYSLC